MFMKAIIILFLMTVTLNVVIIAQPRLKDDKSFENVIKKLKIDEEDKYLLKEVEQVKTEADSWLKEADVISKDLSEVYRIVETAAKFDDIRKIAFKKAQKMEGNIFVLQSDALEYFELSNDILYTFYKKYHVRIFPEVDNNTIAIGNQMMKDADKMWTTAKELRESGYLEESSIKSIEKHIKAQKMEEEVISMQEKAYSLLMNSDWHLLTKINYALLEPAVESTPCIDNKTNVAINPVPEKSNLVQTEKEIVMESTFANTEKKTEMIKAANQRITYKIQVGAFLSKPDELAFKGVRPLSTEKNEQGFTRYLAGEYRNFEVAVRALDILKNTGFTDAFLVTYSDDVRVSPVVVSNENMTASGK